jgi:hypothetical protein
MHLGTRNLFYMYLEPHVQLEAVAKMSTKHRADNGSGMKVSAQAPKA